MYILIEVDEEMKGKKHAVRMNCTIKKIVSGFLVFALLIPGCSSHEKKNSSSFSSRSESISLDTTETSLEEVVNTPSAEDLFYHSEQKNLYAPDLLDGKYGYLQYSYSDKPLFTEHYVLVHSNQRYSWRTLDQAEEYYFHEEDFKEVSRWSVFNLSGNYLCDLPIEDTPYGPVYMQSDMIFDEDEQGNIVALYSRYDETSEYEGQKVYASKYAASGEEIMPPTPIFMDDSNSPVGIYMGKQDEVVFATSSHLVSANLNGIVHSVCTFPENSSCIGLWKENDAFYILTLPVYTAMNPVGNSQGDPVFAPKNDGDTRINSSLLFPFTVTENGMICVAGDGKAADGMMTMHIGSSINGHCAATKNAIGTFNFESGEFCSLLDWNQTDADLNLVINGRFRVTSEGMTGHPLNMFYSQESSLPGMSITVVERSVNEMIENGMAESDIRIVPSQSEMNDSVSPEQMMPTTDTSLADRPSEETTTLTSESEMNSETEAGIETTVTPSETDQPVTEIYVASTAETRRGNVPLLLKLTQMEENPHQNQKVIWMGGVHLVDSPVATAIRQYNLDANHPIWIKLHEYTDFVCNDDYGCILLFIRLFALPSQSWYLNNNDDHAAMERMIDQVSSGNGPDIIYGGGEIGALDRHGYLTDLRPYMNGKNGIHEDDYFTSVFDAFEVDSKLFQIPLSFRLVSMLQHTSSIENEGVFSFDDALALQDELEEPLFPTYLTGYTMMVLASSKMNDWVNYDSRIAQATSKEMEDFLRFCSLILSKSEEDQYYMEDILYCRDWCNVGSVISEEDSPLIPVEIGSPEEYGRITGWKDDYSWSGLLGTDTALTSVHTDCTVGITSYSTQKETAWEVVQYLLSDEAQSLLRPRLSIFGTEDEAMFPVARSVFYQDYFQMIDATDYYLTDGSYYTARPKNVDAEKNLENMLSAPHSRYIYDQDILYILVEVCNKCNMGEVTYEEAAAELIERINLIDDN